jgi:glucosamine 6-phosphate synthetase-like amidotransferase/phosphosugar isomerase protein
MCGVIGLIYEKPRDDLGRIAAELLRTLEYRGYDSTGAAIQNAGEEVILRKGVGAPSTMVRTLGIVDLPGQILCGQVRWATFGAVTDANSQPHVVRCKVNIYGAHNGNVTNCDQLKSWLTDEGHRVLSDNDGEMVVHTVEHCFARALLGQPTSVGLDPKVRRAAMRKAVVAAAARLEGSYAAVIVDPTSRTLWAIKEGSSLYFGVGADEKGGKFAIASSDLSSVLKLTRAVVPLREGEFVEFDISGHRLHSIEDGAPIERAPVRSRLRAEDTALSPPFETFMDQEISAQESTCRHVVRLFLGDGEKHGKFVPPPAADLAKIAARFDTLRDQYDDAQIRSQLHALVDSPELRAVLARLPREFSVEESSQVAAAGGAERLRSSEAGFLADLLPMARDAADRLAVRWLDALLDHQEATEFTTAVARFLDYTDETLARGGRLFVVCCGSSYNAARAAALFWNDVARTDLVPLLPGEFRERVSHSLRDGDLLIAVSQSGETKDLIDVMNDTIASRRAIRRVAIVNNVNSTLGEEKSDLVIPLRCGPEVAVPATKSFMNQMAVFYGLALAVAERRAAKLPADSPERAAFASDIALRRERFSSLPALLRATFDATASAIEEAAQLLYLRSSIHLLATRLTALAREGALKIREVVLNHAEGFEGSEFKHGPNTILGWNTILGPREVDALLRRVGQLIDGLVHAATEKKLPAGATHRLIQAATDAVLADTPTHFALAGEERALFEKALDRNDLLRPLSADYPLLYLTGPDERDVNLTISQINTHKIRGATTIVIAEEHPMLRAAVEKPPSDNPGYRWVYVTLPRTDDILMTVFSATVALQRLALRMSLLKMQYLDRLGVKEHGVHPDVPKNVSKSITVD